MKGTHAWALDDITYLQSSAHGDDEEAPRLVRALASAAQRHGLRLEVVVSSRRAPPAGVEGLGVGPLTPGEAGDLARRAWAIERPGMRYSGDQAIGAAQLFAMMRRATAPYKKALLLALASGRSYRQYADELGRPEDLATMHLEDLAKKMTEREVTLLGELAPRHGFSYEAFLGVYFPLIERASYFTTDDLESWFSDKLLTPGYRGEIAAAHKRGLSFLARLNFAQIDRRQEKDVWVLPPNQRFAMQALANPAARLPGNVPQRGARERLSLALEGVGQGDLVALGALLAMEREFADELSEPDSAAAVFYSRLLRAELAPDRALELYDAIVRDHDARDFGASSWAVEASIAAATALVNKGVRLGQEGRSAEEVAVYDEVVSRYGERPEAALAEQVAKALVNKGITFSQEGRGKQAKAVFDEVVSRYGERPEIAIHELVTKARSVRAVPGE